MVKRLGLVAAAVAVVIALAGCEPSMTITAKDDAGAYGTTCGDMIHVNGTVTPATATAKVVLQTTKSGKWVDAKGWSNFDDAYHATPYTLTANVGKSSGNYSIPYVVDWFESSKHLRVRSAGGGSFSPSFYVKSTGVDGYC